MPFIHEPLIREKDLGERIRAGEFAYEVLWAREAYTRPERQEARDAMIREGAFLVMWRSDQGLMVRLLRADLAGAQAAVEGLKKRLPGSKWRISRPFV